MTTCISPMKESELTQALNVVITASPHKQFKELDAEVLDCHDEVRDLHGHAIYRPDSGANNAETFQKIVEQWQAWKTATQHDAFLLNLGTRAYTFRKRSVTDPKLSLTAALETDHQQPSKVCAYEPNGLSLCREMRGSQQELIATDSQGRVEVSLLNNPEHNPDFLMETFFPTGSLGDTVRLSVKQRGEIRGKTSRSNFFEKGTQYHLVAHQGLSVEGKAMMMQDKRVFSVSLDFTRKDRTLIRFQTDAFTYEYIINDAEQAATLSRTHNETMRSENLDPALVENGLSVQFAFLMGYLANTTLMRHEPSRNLDTFFELVTTGR